jgi:hypothetical protein
MRALKALTTAGLRKELALVVVGRALQGHLPSVRLVLRGLDQGEAAEKAKAKARRA